MNTTDTGKNLGKCFKIVSQAYEEIDALIAALRPFFDGMSPSNKCKKEMWYGWVSNGFNDNFIASWDLNEEGHFIGFQISLHGVGMDIGKNEEPLLHVFKWDTGGVAPDLVNFCMSYPLGEIEKPELLGESLISWRYEEGNGSDWTFSLRLAALTNKAALEEHIFKPITNLLSMPSLTQKEYEDKPLKPWEGLIRYNTKDGRIISIKAADEK